MFTSVTRFFHLLLLATLAGCGSVAQSVFDIRPEDKPVYETLLRAPDTDTSSFVSFDLTRIVYRTRLPKGDSCKAILVFIHGTAAQSKLYLPLADTLAAQGIGTVLPDLRGHGFTTGYAGDAIGDVRSLDALVRDVRLLLDTVRAKFPDKKILLGGHSLGAALAVKFVEHFSTIDAWRIKTGLASNSDAAAANGVTATGLNPNKKLYREPDGFVLMSGGFLPADSAVRRPMPNGRAFATIAGSAALYLPAGLVGIHPQSIEIILPNDVLVREAMEKKLLTTRYALQFLLASFPVELRRTYRTMQSPALFVIGTEDELLSVSDAAVSAQKVNSPVRDLVTVEGANHISIIWKSAAAIGRWIRTNISDTDNN